MHRIFQDADGGGLDGDIQDSGLEVKGGALYWQTNCESGTIEWKYTIAEHLSNTSYCVSV